MAREPTWEEVLAYGEQDEKPPAKPKRKAAKPKAPVQPEAERAARDDAKTAPDRAAEKPSLPEADDDYDIVDRFVRVRWFEEAEDATQDERAEAQKDRDYYDGYQLTAEEIAALQARGQPPLVINRIKRKIDYLRGLEIRQRTDIKAWPRNPQDDAAAHAATDALRFIADAVELKQTTTQVWENLLIEGVGGAEVVVEDAGEENPEIRVIPVPWDRIFRDPHSRRHDMSDAKYCGVVLWMDADDARERWPEVADAAITSAIGEGRTSDTYDDRPRDGGWWDTKRNRIRIVQMYHRDARGRWMRSVFTRWAELEEPEEVPFLDDKGNSACPLILVSAYVDRNNRRYGAVREMRDPQDEVNKRRSRALHHFTTRTIIAEDGAVVDEDKARAEAARPDGFIKVSPNARFEFVTNNDMANGHLALLQEAKAELDLSGPNAALMGQQDSAPSGRAIQLNQQGGMIEIGALTDALRNWQRRVYAAIWDRVRQYWTAEQWIRITDDERNLRWVGLNQQVTLRDKLMEMQPDQAAVMARGLGIVSEDDPRLAQVVEVRNQTNEMHVDIVLDDAPDIATVQQEEFQTLAELARAGMPIPPAAIIRASSLRNKDDILQEIEAAQQAAAAAAQGQGGGDNGAAAMAEVQRKTARDQRELELKEHQLQAKVALDAGALALREKEANTRLALRASAPLRAAV